MHRPPPAPEESARLEALRRYQILDTPPNETFDRLTKLAAHVFDVPTALITLIDEGRQWFKSRVNLSLAETSREIAFCAHTILGSDVLVVPDARQDPRFADNPLVTGDPHIRFYAGAPLRTEGGHNVGSLALLAYEPRTFSDSQRTALAQMAALAVDELELWRRLQQEKLAAVDAVVRESEQRLRQAEKMEALGQLAGGVAHDFNNVLSVILSYASFAHGSVEAGHPIRDDLSVICAAVERGAALTRQILAFGRRQALQREPLDLNAAVMEAASVLERVLPATIEVRKQLAEPAPIVLADAAQVQQAIWNLCINARDAMPSGGVITLRSFEVELDSAQATTFVDAHAGKYGVLAVEDTGSGMGPDVLQRIFEPFFTTKEPGRGTGLGLPSVYGTVRQHDGFVDVKSAVGRGSAFRVYLPATTPQQRRARVTLAPAAGETVTILLVEDDEALSRIAQRILRDAGYTVVTALNGEQAVERFGEQPHAFRLVLLDLNLPRLGGVEALERIRALRGDVCVLITTGYASEELPRYETNPPAVLQKPYDAASLLAAVRSVLHGDAGAGAG